MIKPKRLKKGQTIGIISPSSGVWKRSELWRSIEEIENWGYNVKVGENAYKKRFYLAGSDEERAKDLLDFFKDDDIDAIFCSQGGYGSARILKYSDFDMFIWGWGGDVDPSTLLRVLTTKQIDNLNDSFYSNPHYDKIVDEQASIMDFDERQKTVYEAQKILYEELPYIILMYEKELQLIRKDRLLGLKPTVNGAIFYAF